MFRTSSSVIHDLKVYAVENGCIECLFGRRNFSSKEQELPSSSSSCKKHFYIFMPAFIILCLPIFADSRETLEFVYLYQSVDGSDGSLLNPSLPCLAFHI